MNGLNGRFAPIIVISGCFYRFGTQPGCFRASLPYFYTLKTVYAKNKNNGQQ